MRTALGGGMVPALSMRRTFVYEARSTSMANVVVASSAVFVNLLSSIGPYRGLDCSSGVRGIVGFGAGGGALYATDPPTKDGDSAVTVIDSATAVSFISVASPTDVWLGIFTMRLMVCSPSSSNFSAYLPAGSSAM